MLLMGKCPESIQRAVKISARTTLEAATKPFSRFPVSLFTPPPKVAPPQLPKPTLLSRSSVLESPPATEATSAKLPNASQQTPWRVAERGPTRSRAECRPPRRLPGNEVGRRCTTWACRRCHRGRLPAVAAGAARGQVLVSMVRRAAAPTSYSQSGPQVRAAGARGGSYVLRAGALFAGALRPALLQKRAQGKECSALARALQGAPGAHCLGGARLPCARPRGRRGPPGLRRTPPQAGRLREHDDDDEAGLGHRHHRHHQQQQQQQQPRSVPASRYAEVDSYVAPGPIKVGGATTRSSPAPPCASPRQACPVP
eukprot:scaffold1971_cov374-Prasinococcus_capsulatus_cf.AAC.4